MTRQLVLIRWVDSSALFYGERWASEEDLDRHMEETFCESVGWVIRENDHSVYVAASVAPEEIGAVTQIPVCAIVRRDRLQAVP